MPQPTITRVETEASLIKKLQEENALLRHRLQQSIAVGGSNSNPQQQQQQSTSSSAGTPAPTTHQSRLSSFHNKRPTGSMDGKRHQSQRTSSLNPQTLNDIVPFDIPAPAHIVDDFYIIAQESVSIGNSAELQARGLRSLIRNISSGGSPVMGRKESMDRGKKRSGSVGSRW